MALDPRFYRHIGQSSGPGSISSATSSDSSALTSITSPSVISTSASIATMRSSASSPSLRARKSVSIPVGRQDGIASPSPGGNVRVVVRVRKFLQRELDRQAECLIAMDPHTQMTSLRAPKPSPGDRGKPKSQARGKVLEDKSFTFDNSFWSHDDEDEHYAHQEDVYNCLGEEFLDHNFEGYHTCIFAYGQTGSGKSYTMMGTPEQPGLIPRTCEDLFQRIESSPSPDISYNVRVSYFEVYNEHVRDLLVPRTDPPHYLRIRESPSEGPYVKDLTEVTARNYAELMRYMRKGDLSRTVASTKMNDTSSRSHAVFTITLKQIHHDLSTDETTERTARIRLVDLAGSERAKATEATGARLREGSNINKSLTTLGRVIAALADPKKIRGGRKGKELVPYRDSILTWLLKDSLGGNSKTAMIACISPADYEETLSTLRYADQAKRIRTRARVNQDHVSAAERDQQIAEMAETIRTLQLSVSQAHANQRATELQDERMEEYQQKVEKMQRLMEETKMVSECKIRQLQTENEALRMHLKLALESLRNPIPPVTLEPRRSLSSLAEEEQLPDTDQENREGSPVVEPSDSEPEVWEDDDDDEYDDDDTITLDNSEQEAYQMQERMQDLLGDLGVFKRKLATDHERWRPNEHSRTRKRRVLGTIAANNR
ncbi:Putative Kinesin family protein [Penicillium brasilianum]|uniref:Kinesin-like protein n=1 Tax=Penicillium brasilianum TaxID=104259 RepID=A0A0F7TSE5_PENBI|nr:Putative Kinesin family protein [Penicillium brasilianum]